MVERASAGLISRARERVAAWKASKHKIRHNRFISEYDGSGPQDKTEHHPGPRSKPPPSLTPSLMMRGRRSVGRCGKMHRVTRISETLKALRTRAGMQVCDAWSRRFLNINRTDASRRRDSAGAGSPKLSASGNTWPALLVCQFAEQIEHSQDSSRLDARCHRVRTGRHRRTRRAYARHPGRPAFASFQ